MDLGVMAMKGYSTLSRDPEQGTSFPWGEVSYLITSGDIVSI